MAKKKRTEMRSKAGKKLYAVRDEQGEFTDIQTYQRAHGQDIKRKSKAELESAAKKKAPTKKATKAAKPVATKKKKKKKVAKKKSAKRGK